MQLRILALTGAAVVASALADAESSAHRRSAMMNEVSRDALQREESRIKERQRRIKAECAALDRDNLDDSDWAKEWAGRYYAGDGLGMNATVWVAPDSGISFLNYGCLGLYGGDHGEIVGFDPDGLRLDLVFGTAQDSYLSERVYFVKWNEERYLVSDWQMMDIVNDYNRGRSIRMFSIPRLVREGENRRWNLDTREPVSSKPELPERFDAMLFDKPVMLRVTSVSDYAVEQIKENTKLETCTVVFDRGTDANIHAGMEFQYRLKQSAPAYGELRVTSSDNGIATAKFKMSSWDQADTKMPERGDIVLAGRDSEVRSDSSL